MTAGWHELAQHRHGLGLALRVAGACGSATERAAQLLDHRDIVVMSRASRVRFAALFGYRDDTANASQSEQIEPPHTQDRTRSKDVALSVSCCFCLKAAGICGEISGAS